MFVSYSRSDRVAMDRIRLALESQGMECLVDTRDLPYGEQWQTELGILIRRADAVCFVLSPRSIQSTWCRWELAEINLTASPPTFVCWGPAHHPLAGTCAGRAGTHGVPVP